MEACHLHELSPTTPGNHLYLGQPCSPPVRLWLFQMHHPCLVSTSTIRVLSSTYTVPLPKSRTSSHARAKRAVLLLIFFRAAPSHFPTCDDVRCQPWLVAKRFDPTNCALCPLIGHERFVFHLLLPSTHSGRPVDWARKHMGSSSLTNCLR